MILSSVEWKRALRKIISLPEIGAPKEILRVSSILTYSTLKGTKIPHLPLSQGAVIQTETKDSLRPRGWGERVMRKEVKD